MFVELNSVIRFNQVVFDKDWSMIQTACGKVLRNGRGVAFP